MVGQIWKKQAAKWRRQLLMVSGTVALLGGMTVVVSLTTVGAQANGNPTLSLTIQSSGTGTCSTPTLCTGLADGDSVNVSGSGFSNNQSVAFRECNSDPAQPDVVWLGINVPVSCTRIRLSTSSGSGTISPTTFPVHAGVTGPQAPSTTDSCTTLSSDPIPTAHPRATPSSTPGTIRVRQQLPRLLRETPVTSLSPTSSGTKRAPRSAW